ncbi:hypothetical protein BpHYR1_046202 [Brachionus plicatilis]|uniref:Uncharacterized protein n=1 Tax=Brachionus plicatilis TaxID=10195 RepID=A0A3M7Q2Z0_BRAPC|nr:hypothetical protein BpHYR1_046202 [Brachionus plicatilis]
MLPNKDDLMLVDNLFYGEGLIEAFDQLNQWLICQLRYNLRSDPGKRLKYNRRSKHQLLNFLAGFIKT